MNKKHIIIAGIVGLLVGYIAQNYIAKVPGVSALPVLGTK